jgi:hypothetical protein
MPLPQTFYVNGVSLGSATAVFLDPNLTVCAPNGYYSDGTIVRQQVDCVLLPQQTCPNCCNEVCSSWAFSVTVGSATFEYIECQTQAETQVTWAAPAEGDICVAYGTTPILISGDASLSLLQQCGCCSEEETCNNWTVSGVVGFVDVAYTNCSNVPILDTFTTDSSFCALAGTVPTVIDGTGSIFFNSCGCPT